MQPYNSRPPLQPIQRQAGGFGVPSALAAGRYLQVPSRVNDRFGHYQQPASTVSTPSYASPTAALFSAELPAAEPHAYHPTTFITPKMPHAAPHRSFPVGPFVVAVIVLVTIAGAYAGYHQLNSPPPVNAASTNVYSNNK